MKLFLKTKTVLAFSLECAEISGLICHIFGTKSDFLDKTFQNLGEIRENSFVSIGRRVKI